jgi:hypothetical protein
MGNHDQFVRDEWARLLTRDLRGGVLYFKNRGVPRVGGISEVTDMSTMVRYDLAWCACPTEDGLSLRADKRVWLPKSRFANSDSPDVIKFAHNEIHLGDAVTVTVEMAHRPLTRDQRRARKQPEQQKKSDQDTGPGPLFAARPK